MNDGYPMDTSFAVFSIASIAFAMYGIMSGIMSLVLFGILTLVASLIGWLMPADRKIFALNPVQICSLLYMTSGITCMISGILSENIFVILAGICWITSNTILYTVRKENQSAYTIVS